MQKIDFRSKISLQDLASRVEYESWLLESIYDIANEPLAVPDVDELIFEPDGRPPTQTIYAAGAINIGDWRPGFLQVGAPLIFVTEFKLLDMLFEWILVLNGKRSTFRFMEKIEALRGAIEFPAVIQERPWLRERIVGLYEHLEPLRGTVIHERHFKSSGGSVEVSSSKKGVVGPKVSVSSEDLRGIASVVVSLIRLVPEEWRMDPFSEKRLRFTLDQLAEFHQQPGLSQKQPGYVNARVYESEREIINVDLAKIRSHIAAWRPNQDVVLNLRIVAVDTVNRTAKSYLIPHEHLPNVDRLEMPRPNLEPFFCHQRDDFDVAKIADVLSVRNSAR